MDYGIIAAFLVGIGVGLFGAFLLNFANKRRKQQFEQQTGILQHQLGELTKLIRETDAQRQKQYGGLDEHLNTLTKTTGNLQSVLANERRRGAWGEQIASGILQAAGFVDGTHYVQQKNILNVNDIAGRPDFTFLLPNDLCIHMDVKFPFNKYEQYLSADTVSGEERKRYLKEFAKDVKDKVNETCKYISNDSLEYVLMFIPNESLFHFLTEDEAVRTYALEKKVIICSPMSLLVVLAIIRQACEIFGLEKSLGNIRALVKNLSDDLSKYAGELDTVEERLADMQLLVSELKTKRTHRLKKNAESLQALIFKQTDSIPNLDPET